MKYFYKIPVKRKVHLIYQKKKMKLVLQDLLLNLSWLIVITTSFPKYLQIV